MVRNKKIVILALPVVAILLLVGALVLSSLFDSPADKTKKLEDKMTSIVSSYYDENIKGMVIGVHKQIVTLEELQKQDYDITDFVKAECSLESFSYVILENPSETDKAKIKYSVENHLDCK